MSWATEFYTGKTVVDGQGANSREMIRPGYNMSYAGNESCQEYEHGGYLVDM